MSPLAAGSKKNIMLGKISHALVGLTLLLKGWDKAEHFNSHPFTVVFLFAAGVFIILGAAFHHQIEKKIPNFTALFHVAEGIALVLIGFALLEKSSRLPYFYLFAGVIYQGLGGFEFFTDADEKKRLRPLLFIVMGTVFLLAAIVFLAFNFFNSRDTWAYITTGVFAVMGIFLLLIRKRKFSSAAD